MPVKVVVKRVKGVKSGDPVLHDSGLVSVVVSVGIGGSSLHVGHA